VLEAALCAVEPAFCAAEAAASPALVAAFCVVEAAFCAVEAAVWPALAAAAPVAPAAAPTAPGTAELLLWLLLISGELVLEALPGPVEQLEEIMLALSTLMVSPLAVPVTETVWPTWSLKAELFLDCNFHALPLLSVSV
jgi:hypothetical protein